jgi:hypothetical protein
MKNLSKTQYKVLQLMNEGWQLGTDTFNKNRTWLQKNGIGYGGETFEVKQNTLNSLKRLNLIDFDKKQYPVNIFKLNKLGKKTFFVNEVINNGGRILDEVAIPGGRMVYYLKDSECIFSDVSTKSFLN